MKLDIVRAWKDEAYRESLTEEEKAMLPANPAGELELTEADLQSVNGAGAAWGTSRWCGGETWHWCGGETWHWCGGETWRWCGGSWHWWCHRGTSHFICGGFGFGFDRHR